ncbi:MAG: hypothetical protein WA324_20595 [Bryobacteraceae bacterium]
MALKDYSARDKYTYPNSPVLINLADIRDGERLEQFEADMAFRRLLQLANRPLEGHFDLEHLKAIHQYIFQDVFGWAQRPWTLRLLSSVLSPHQSRSIGNRHRCITYPKGLRHPSPYGF